VFARDPIFAINLARIESVNRDSRSLGTTPLAEDVADDDVPKSDRQKQKHGRSFVRVRREDDFEADTRRESRHQTLDDWNIEPEQECDASDDEHWQRHDDVSHAPAPVRL